MINLLKADLYRVIKDKMFIILCIIGLALSILLPLLYVGLYQLIGPEGITMRELTSALSITDMVASPTQAYGLVVAIFVLVLIGKDNSTLRNKIIVGKSRFEIFISNVLLTVILYCGFMLAHIILTFSFSSIFFQSGFGSYDATYIIVGILFKLLGLLAVSLMLAFFAMSLKNMAISIILFVVTMEVTSFIGSLIEMIAFPLSNAEGYEHLRLLFEFLKCLVYSLFTYSSSMVLTVNHDLAFCLSYIISIIGFSTLFVGLGYLIFKNKELK